MSRECKQIKFQIRISSQDGIQTVARNQEKRLYQDRIKSTCFEPTRCLDSVPVHWVTHPSHNLSCSANGPDQVRKLNSHVLSTHSDYDCYSSRLVNGIQDLYQINKFIWIHLLANLQKKFHLSQLITTAKYEISCPPFFKATKRRPHVPVDHNYQKPKRNNATIIEYIT